ncbi:MAG TPA: glucan biosynthesis protein [Archangium sp.]|uniref:glucan biosynthesis protein n=1 Tax=Archangium sp. TaxID=1872627 RepID=UPI002E34A932|nr:glucan biosynthesis protein [Archangium sp.]HEX5749272.1 glucan biosynthesis protein [Archangium sp.]
MNGTRAARCLSVSSFQVDGPRTFGLLQRDQAFTSYEDLEARYDKRPGVWVEPVGDWGRVTVQLVEIPTPQEMHDNIVAYWVPEAPFTPGTGLRLGWRLHWGSTPPERSPLAHTTATREAAGSTPGARRFVLEFSRGGGEGTGPVEAVVTTSTGQVLHPTAQHNDVTGTGADGSTCPCSAPGTPGVTAGHGCGAARARIGPPQAAGGNARASLHAGEDGGAAGRGDAHASAEPVRPPAHVITREPVGTNPGQYMSRAEPQGAERPPISGKRS